MRPINKLFIDSRCKTPTSVSSSHFRVELAEADILPEGTGACVTDVSIPRTW